MEVYDFVLDATAVVLNWNLSERVLGDALWVQACAMARVPSEELTQLFDT